MSRLSSSFHAGLFKTILGKDIEQEQLLHLSHSPDRIEVEQAPAYCEEVRQTGFWMGREVGFAVDSKNSLPVF
jgi:hypothetical protein